MTVVVSSRASARGGVVGLLAAAQRERRTLAERCEPLVADHGDLSSRIADRGVAASSDALIGVVQRRLLASAHTRPDDAKAAGRARVAPDGPSRLER